ncbi:2-C-methyl-D-erythritol 2,4-cyclodiphosphate synthase [bacterium]|nr:2-C-methyl-D-erythritol 2,4-cyclodiphosphate synthase [bacterium]
MRIGQGFDSHRLENGLKLTIGGVEIPSEFGFVAHSDGDILIHATIDAILGALNNHDIGWHFPDTDPQYKNINSMILLEKTREILDESDFEIINIDSTITIEKPKMNPHIENMKKNLASALKIKEEQISIKAKTNEKKDAIGACELASANVIVLLKNRH